MPEVGTWTVRRILEWTTAYFARKDVDPARWPIEEASAKAISGTQKEQLSNFATATTNGVIGGSGHRFEIWFPLVDAFRTFCLRPGTQGKALLAEVQHLQ